ncbi:MAG: amidohydrolase family protein [SAR202 cluster bacterium]|nr:amidohydrolase family protein [SAR202 cluster bacterium]
MTAFDTVILNGRVMDPESGFDAIANIGISGGAIKALSGEPLKGNDTLDASGLVVGPGFIDLHSHGQDAENYAIQAQDGVTTALELEVGAADMHGWYAQREGRSLINFGATSGHIPARMKVLKDPGWFLPMGDAAHRPATDGEISQVLRAIEQGLEKGALGVGMGLQYTRAASRWEVLEVFRLAARYKAPCHVHIRGMGKVESVGAVEALEEVIAAAYITGAPLHVVHISSSGLNATGQLLELVGQARERGLDITTECYPYTAGMSGIETAIFDDGWQEKLGVTYSDLLWPSTGETLTAESFARYRKQQGMVVVNFIPEQSMDAAVTSPLTAIATDGYLRNGAGHPRTAGSYGRLFGHYVRGTKKLTLMDALRKSSLMPAQRLERRAPAFNNKGRVRAGADADLAIFDPKTVSDMSTYQKPALPSVGFRHVLVGGVPVVRDGKLQKNEAPGKGIRAPH